MHSPTRAGSAKASALLQLAVPSHPLGLPSGYGGRAPPANTLEGKVLVEGQALAVDPGIMLAVEDFFAQQAEGSPEASAAAVTWLLWISTVRVAQLHRSTLTALTSSALW